MGLCLASRRPVTGFPVLLNGSQLGAGAGLAGAPLTLRAACSRSEGSLGAVQDPRSFSRSGRGCKAPCVLVVSFPGASLNPSGVGAAGRGSVSSRPGVTTPHPTAGRGSPPPWPLGAGRRGSPSAGENTEWKRPRNASHGKVILLFKRQNKHQCQGLGSAARLVKTWAQLLARKLRNDFLFSCGASPVRSSYGTGFSFQDLFITETHTQHGAGGGAEGDSLQQTPRWARNPTRGSIPRPLSTT